MTDRLPWERDPAGGFVAFPEGKEVESRYARVYQQTHPVKVWHWSVQYGPAVRRGTGSGSQEAADIATETWPEVKVQGEVLIAQEARKAELLTEIERVEVEDDPDISVFAIEAAEYENLMFVMDRLRHKARSPGVLKLMAALSAEFFERRMGRR